MVGLIIDIIIVAVTVIMIVVSCKRGIVKTVMSLVSGVASLFLAYAFTPMLSAILKEKVFLRKFAEGITDTVASLSEAGKNAADKVMYDISGLMENSQFLSLLEKYKADPAQTEDIISNMTDTGSGAVEKVSYAVADNLSETVSDITAFIIIFVVSLIVLKLLTLLICAVFKLPGLKEADKTAGLVLGIVTSVFFILVFSMMINNVSGLLTSISPSTFPENFADQSYILHFLSKYNVISFITEKLGIQGKV